MYNMQLQKSFEHARIIIPCRNVHYMARSLGTISMQGIFPFVIISRTQHSLHYIADLCHVYSLLISRPVYILQRSSLMF